jgi:hypothetical protein
MLGKCASKSKPLAFAKVIRGTRPGDQILKKPEKLDDVKTFVSNTIEMAY